VNKDILKALTGSTSPVLLNERELNSSKVTSFTASFLGVNEVFCLFPGSAIFVGSFDGAESVNILVNKHELIRYTNLAVAPVVRDSQVPKGQKIGEVSPRKRFGFEYCTQWQGDSKYPVRFCGRLFFKQNPKDILNGIYVPPRDIELIEDFVPYYTDVEFTSEQAGEWDTVPEEGLSVDDIPESAKLMLSDNNGGDNIR